MPIDLVIRSLDTDESVSTEQFKDVQALSAWLKKHPSSEGIYYDLSGNDLSGADFTYCHLESANFSDTNLSGANFAQSVLSGARLERATLEKTQLDKVVMIQADFSNANMKGANISFTNMTSSLFDGADMTVNVPEVGNVIADNLLPYHHRG